MNKWMNGRQWCFHLENPIQILYDNLRKCFAFILSRSVANSSAIIELIVQTGHIPLGMHPVSRPDLTWFNTAKTSWGRTAFPGSPLWIKKLSTKVVAQYYYRNTQTFWCRFLVNWVKYCGSGGGEWGPHPPSYCVCHCSGSSARGAPAYFPVWVWLIMSGLCPLRHCS